MKLNLNRFEKPEARGQNFNLFLLPLNSIRSTELRHVLYTVLARRSERFNAC